MPNMSRRFSQVDVFTDTPLLGNPVAVVHDAEGLTTARMHSFTDWTNLSEATFLLRPTHPDADYRVRIFCPGRELPFAGHPTLGTCHAWLGAGGVPRAEGSGDVVQECGAGLIKIRRQADRLYFLAPPRLRSGPLAEDDVARIAAGLGLRREEIVDHQWCDNGPGWQAVLLEDADRVLAIDPDPGLLAGLDVGVVGPRSSGGADVEVRAFFPGNSGLTEDPVTGSLNAALAQWLIGSGRLPEQYTAAQGTAMGRAGRVHVSVDADGIWVGGASVTVVSGDVALPSSPEGDDA
jgi:PhzF family phenazine biosynthesis protein